MRGSDMNTDARFGMAFAGMNISPEEMEDFLGIEEFNAAELPWEILVHARHDTLRKKAAKQFECLYCGGIMDTRLSRNIPFMDAKTVRAFSLQLENSLRTLAEANIHAAVLECPLNGILGNAGAEETLRTILKSASGILLEADITLLLPLSLPEPERNDLPQEAARFIRNTLLPKVKLRLDINPWLIEKNQDIRALAGMLHFECAALMFHYNADGGGRILKRQITPWLDYLSVSAFSGAVLLCPHSAGNRMAMPEADSFSKIISELKTEQSGGIK